MSLVRLAYVLALVALAHGCVADLGSRRGGGRTGPQLAPAGADAGTSTPGDGAIAGDAATPPSVVDASTSLDPCAALDCGRHGACVVVASAPSCACTSGYEPTPDGRACVRIPTAGGVCEGVDCGEHGACDDTTGAAVCACAPGYAADGLACVAIVLDPCVGVTCSGHGTCAPFGGRALCACDAGFTSTGAGCVPSDGPNPCDGVDCEGHGSCFVLEQSGLAACSCDDGYYAYISRTDCRAVSGTVCDGVSCGAGTCHLLSLGPLGVGSDCLCPPGYLQHGSGCMRAERTHCRDIDGQLVTRGTLRCSHDDSQVEICRDDDGDGLVEWVVTESCAEGACSATGCSMRAGECHTQDDCPNGTVCITGDHGTVWSVGVCMASCDCGNCGNCDPEDFAPSGTNYCGAPAGSTTPTTSCRAPCPSGNCIPFGGGLSVCWPVEGCVDAGEAS